MYTFIMKILLVTTIPKLQKTIYNIHVNMSISWARLGQ